MWSYSHSLSSLREIFLTVMPLPFGVMSEQDEGVITSPMLLFPWWQQAFVVDGFIIIMYTNLVGVGGTVCCIGQGLFGWGLTPPDSGFQFILFHLLHFPHLVTYHLDLRCCKLNFLPNFIVTISTPSSWSYLPLSYCSTDRGSHLVNFWKKKAPCISPCEATTLLLSSSIWPEYCHSDLSKAPLPCHLSLSC